MKRLLKKENSGDFLVLFSFFLHIFIWEDNMEKFEENISYNHGISINERKLVYLTGVVKIESFDEEEFLLETNMGYLAIKGSGLEIVRLDTKDGTLSIKGNVDNLSYFDNLKKNSKTSLMDNLFK